MNRDAHRSYQDTPYPDFRKHVNIWADLERLRPKGDCVLIRMVPEPEMHANLIWIPERARGSNNSPRIGDVVAVGLGDRYFLWVCNHCFGSGDIVIRRTTFHAARPCKVCGGRDFDLAKKHMDLRHPMHVKPGDKVLFWRVPANQHIINNEVFTFIREQQHLLAVIEDDEDAN